MELAGKYSNVSTKIFDPINAKTLTFEFTSPSKFCCLCSTFIHIHYVIVNVLSPIEDTLDALEHKKLLLPDVNTTRQPHEQHPKLGILKRRKEREMKREMESSADLFQLLHIYC